MAIDTRGLLGIQGPSYDVGKSVAEGMEIGNQIKKNRASSALDLLLRDPKNYDETGAMNFSKVLPMIQQSGQADLLLPAVNKMRADYDKATYDAKLSQIGIDKGLQETQKLKRENSGAVMEAVSNAVLGLKGMGPNVNFDHVTNVLSRLKNMGVMDDHQYDTELENARTNQDNLSGYVNGLGLQGMGAKDAMSFAQPKTGVVNSGGTQNFYHTDPFTQAVSVNRALQNTVSPDAAVSQALARERLRQKRRPF